MSTHTPNESTELKPQVTREDVEQARLRLASAEGTLAMCEYAMQADPSLDLNDWHATCTAARDQAQAAYAQAEEALRLSEQAT